MYGDHSRCGGSARQTHFAQESLRLPKKCSANTREPQSIQTNKLWLGERIGQLSLTERLSGLLRHGG